ncbi:hypothetical protein HOR91_gp07 [Xanthomonas phage phi Xc10]|uniref:Uncharacterized protein n=1 Tax=Xanthomonas phage phi Xc10 TaxID=2024237 RepID=A0A249XLN7_9CAUD|nr:hypothetical protein HOR91_gp07 [Xanthomonas phage phi Xc10]ASZ72006.1 hypothetical protein [Xanthomonas phage phi Xc10]
MRKTYFITSIPATAKDGVITGVVANGTGRNATAEEVTALVEFLREKGASQSLLDSLRDSTYPGPVSAFDRRAAARAEAATLNSFGGLFNWSVIELGESIRKPVTKPLGWRITFGGPQVRTVSSHNRHEDATVLIDKEGSADDEYNQLFPTRDAAREVFKQAGLGTGDMGYRIEPYYA